MNTQLLTLYDFNLGYVETLLADVADGELALQPHGSTDASGVNPPGWIVGHLALVNGMIAQTLGGAVDLPESWAVEFGPGSEPTPQTGDAYPPKAELLAALRESHRVVRDLAAKTDLATLDGPNPIEPLRAGLPTVGDLVAPVLTTHFAMHAGHLSNWRRQTGRPPLF